MAAEHSHLTLRVPDAVQREALAERCTADPGPPNSEFVVIPGLQRTVTRGVHAALRPGNASKVSAYGDKLGHDVVRHRRER